MGLAKYAAVVMLLTMAACNSNEPQPRASSTDEVTHELAGTRWALVQLGDKPVTVREGGREAYIVLNSADGSVVGHAGCNRLSTNYKQTGAQLSFSDVITTRMFCPDMPTEIALLEAMKVTAGWRITGSQLELLNGQQTPVARFEARNL